MEYIIMLCVLGLFVFLGMLGYMGERKLWNNGISPHTQKPWERFDTDSQGGRGYKDGSGGYIWISWPVDQLKQ